MSQTIDDLLKCIGRFCAAHGMAESTFGRHAVNDGKFVQRLREGGNLTVGTVERVHMFMKNAPKQKPQGVN